MSLASFALVLGAACYIFGLPIVFADESFLAWRRRVMADEQVLRVLGMLLVMIAVTTLRYHWQVSVDGEGVVIVLAWLTLAKGLFFAWWPARALAVMQRIEPVLVSSHAAQTFIGCLAVFVGAVLTYLGFVLA